MKHKILQYDPSLLPYKKDIDLRMNRYAQKLNQLLGTDETLCDFANGHKYFGFHKTADGWYYREWAPAAEALYLTGDFCNWDRYAYPLNRLENGVFELFLPGQDTLRDGMTVMSVVVHQGQELERIPLYAKRVVQNPVDYSWNAVIYDPEKPFQWTDAGFKPKKKLFIYECHIGMAQEEGKVGSYEEFRTNILPRIQKLGYNTLQIMAIMEHPYYASFGYQVTNFFAPSSRFGRPEELKKLIDTAHAMGISVLLDVVHSHACRNTREGINEFDGTDYQFFHGGEKGNHPAWNTKCFNYDKNEVIHFLLSNLKYWLEEYHFDGFRFDGVTSMLYHDHGLGVAFTDQSKYFSMNTDVEAVTYLQLATTLTRQVKNDVILIAEDTSAIPGLCLSVEDGGIGFDYRLAMGEPDMWIRLLKEVSDQDWDINNIYYELTVRRPREKVIGYCESHDQALVGDKTLMFRLCDREMYTAMGKDSQNLTIDRGMALHKMLRLITMTLGGDGYLTFMGNEFGHPEWIDFPREGNGWSYHYCRRQWSLADDEKLRYSYLNAFEKAAVKLCKSCRAFHSRDVQLQLHNGEKTVVYKKGGGVFVFNFHPTESYDGYFVKMPEAGEYDVVVSTDDFCFGGFGRVFHQRYTATLQKDGRIGFRLYLPSRTALVLKKVGKSN
ncbi:MAG: alpha amylase C-terminal domain-containing protein [Oscillospiraceae bacterium]|nr:alpha amylase C-terminal domain-containing protein [Oscillospiraceae bacterium]